MGQDFKVGDEVEFIRDCETPNHTFKAGEIGHVYDNMGEFVGVKTSDGRSIHTTFENTFRHLSANHTNKPKPHKYTLAHLTFDERIERAALFVRKG